jgi:hypothetical protein
MQSAPGNDFKVAAQKKTDIVTSALQHGAVIKTEGARSDDGYSHGKFLCCPLFRRCPRVQAKGG